MPDSFLLKNLQIAKALNENAVTSLSDWIQNGGNPDWRENAYMASLNDLTDDEHKAMIDDLATKTKSRMNKDGERELLLHRGANQEELPITDRKATHHGISSWSPAKHIAHAFASDYAGEDAEVPTHVVSAWVPEQHIGIYVPHVADTHGIKLPKDRRDEHEVIVGGGNQFDVHSTELPKMKKTEIEPLRKAPLMFDAETHPEQKPYVEVWRMQNATGQGPFNNETGMWQSDWQDIPHSLATGRPDPNEDPGFKQSGSQGQYKPNEWESFGHPGTHRFGFESLDHLNNWFTPAEQKRLEHHGFKPTKVKAKKVWTSGKQVFYEPYHEQESEKLVASERELEKGIYGDWKNEGYAISHTIEHNPKVNPENPWDDHDHTIRVFAHDKNGNLVGKAPFLFHPRHQTLMPAGTRVDEAHRRKGLASAMYSYAENIMGKPVVDENPGGRTKDAEALWAQPNRMFGMRKRIVKIEESVYFEELIKAKREKLCCMFMFDGVAHPDVLHVTHKYFRDFKDLKKLIQILEKYFADHPFHDIKVKFADPEMFGENKDVKVLRPAQQKVRLFLPDLKDMLEEIEKDKWTEYKPHVAVSDNIDELDIPVVDYAIVSGGNILWSVRGLHKSESAADIETEEIKENKKKPEAHERHEFKAAKWTHPNGHPRCVICGQEERVDGMCDPLDKSNYGPKNMGLYTAAPNEKRKSNRTGIEAEGAGPNRAVKEIASGGRDTGKQQAAREAAEAQKKSRMNPVKVYSKEEIAHLEAKRKLAASEHKSDWKNAPVQVQDWRMSYLQHRSHPTEEIPAQHDILDSLREKMLNEGQLTYDPKRGFIRNRRIADRGTKEPLMRAEPGSVKLIHYSQIPNLKEINPEFHGTGAKDAMIARSGKTSVPVSYFYRHGTEPEAMVANPAKSLYHATLGPQHKLYDLANDHKKLVQRALDENQGAWNTENILGKIKGEGYHGFFNSKSALPNAVALFHPHPVDKEEVLK